ncbi:phage tail protein [Fundidesulfovibrio terrae]|uniref:phage tail protein n=1 Tax=Fundidesulfovibrio terrae TaxID=2922866 RepID=UPI001FAF49D2|nr:phage tail protein [Fundidesulfovibrio terrae]
MAYTRTTVIDASPSGDSVKQAVLDLDADLTGAFDGLNQIQAVLSLKINQSEYDQPSGVPRLDASGKIQAGQLPGTLADLPIGMIAPFGLETLPTGSNWLECNGSELSIADYQSLYAAIGNAFGLAASPSNFKLPDLRGQFLRGWDHGRGLDPDAAVRTGGDHVGSTQADIMKKHCHPIGGVVGTAGGGTGVVDCQAWDNGPYNYGTTDFTHTTDKNVGSLDADPYYGRARGNETRPVNTAVMYCVKWR